MQNASTSVPDSGSITLTEPEPGLAVITLDRPPANALDWPMREALGGLITELSSRSDVRGVVLASGSARFFSAGTDIGEHLKHLHLPNVGAVRLAREQLMLKTLARFRGVTVAALDGYALGGGLELACACDFRVAAEGARLGVPEVNLAASPGQHIFAMLAMTIGLGRLRRMVLSGEPISAATALEWGLVDRVVPGRALDAAVEFVRPFLEKPPEAIAELKGVLWDLLEPNLQTLQSSMPALLERIQASPEFQARLAAFLRKDP